MDKKRVVGYVRVSTKKQKLDGVSIPIQRAKLAAYADVMDLDLVEIIEDDGKSAKNLKRPGIKRVLEMLTKGEVDGVLITKLDRLTRSVRDLGSLIEQFFAERPTVRSCILLSVGDSIDTRTAAGRLVLNVLASVGQWEREVISERTQEAMDLLKEQGVKLGGSRLEGPAVIRAKELHAEGCCYREIARTLTEEGHKTKFDKRWGHETVKQILTRPEISEAA